MESGHVVAFAGPLRHGGFPVLSGTRYILVLFMYAEDFAYHEYLQQQQESRERSAASNYVVYRETLELMSTLNKKSSSWD